MRRLLVVVIAGATLACRAGQPASPQPRAGVPTSATLKSGGPDDSAAAIRSANERIVAEVLRSIAGHESEPAGRVFTDVRRLKDVPASTLLDIMSVGYANALGVGCAHCHDLSDFSSDAKRPKRAAREMQALHRGINTQLLAMESLETQPPERRYINCTTCHQGRINPNKR
jgi:hypothetical protein